MRAAAQQFKKGLFLYVYGNRFRPADNDSKEQPPLNEIDHRARAPPPFCVRVNWGTTQSKCIFAFLSLVSGVGGWMGGSALRGRSKQHSQKIEGAAAAAAIRRAASCVTRQSFFCEPSPFGVARSTAKLLFASAMRLKLRKFTPNASSLIIFWIKVLKLCFYQYSFTLLYKKFPQNYSVNFDFDLFKIKIIKIKK